MRLLTVPSGRLSATATCSCVRSSKKASPSAWRCGGGRLCMAERTASRHDYGLRYLMPFREQFVAAAREQSVDPAQLFGIARQESRFASDIVSSASMPTATIAQLR